MRKYIIILSFVATLFCSCKTVNLEEAIQPEQETESEAEHIAIDGNIAKAESDKLLVQKVIGTTNFDKQIVFVDKPVYVPAQEKSEKPSGVSATIESQKNIVLPENYSGSAMVYDYNSDFLYEIHTQMGQTTNITLQMGEEIIGEVLNADPIRFVIGVNYSIENGIKVFHIFVKPKVSGCVNTLTVCTNKRTYNLLIRSYTNVFMPMVRWNYYDTGMINNTGSDTNETTLGVENEYVNPLLLSFDYKMTYWRKPDWAPVNVYDDGAKTYIVMPKQVLQKEIPACFENKDEIINYRVNDNVFVIDKLIRKITLKYDGKTVTIEKKQAVK